MTKSKAITKPSPVGHAVVVEQTKDENPNVALARALLDPGIRHGALGVAFAAKVVGKHDVMPDIGDYTESLRQTMTKTGEGDLKMASKLLTAQAMSLDGIFTELARRAAANMGEYMQATESYLRLALKAQANSRATVEALAKLHQPREQTVRHVHVNEGGKAVIADEFHLYKRIPP
jgi:hypothetical protein